MICRNSNQEVKTFNFWSNQTGTKYKYNKKGWHMIHDSERGILKETKKPDCMLVQTWKIFLKALGVNVNEDLLSSLSCNTDFNKERANCPHYSSKIFSKYISALLRARRIIKIEDYIRLSLWAPSYTVRFWCHIWCNGQIVIIIIQKYSKKNFTPCCRQSIKFEEYIKLSLWAPSDYVELTKVDVSMPTMQGLRLPMHRR